VRKPPLLALALVLPLAAQVKFTRQPERVLVSIEGKPYTTFYLAPGGNKPYVWPLSTASGIVVTRHFPMESYPGETNDHPHHRGMFFSHGDINGTNFWATEPGQSANAGKMIFKRILEMKDGKEQGTLRAIFDGEDSHGKVIMTETRTLVFHDDSPRRTIDFEIEIRAVEPLVFADTKEGTFGIRLATSMSEDKGGRMVNAEDKDGEKNVWGKRSAWVDYYGTVDGKPVGVTIHDDPRNPRHPTYWHSRAYGLLAANPFGVRDFTGDKTLDGSMNVARGDSVTFRYRVVIHE
jgi:Family of unknown function (DUF6807)